VCDSIDVAMQTKLNLSLKVKFLLLPLILISRAWNNKWMSVCVCEWMLDTSKLVLMRNLFCRLIVWNIFLIHEMMASHTASIREKWNWIVTDKLKTDTGNGNSARLTFMARTHKNHKVKLFSLTDFSSVVVVVAIFWCILRVS
jgi:hypothetical protein